MKKLLLAVLPLAPIQNPIIAPTQMHKVYAYDPIAQDAFEATQDFVVTVYGSAAVKLFSYYGPTQWEFHNTDLDCYSARASFGLLEQACHLVFHPADHELSVHAGNHTFVLKPQFEDGRLKTIVIDDIGDSDAGPLVNRSCFNLKNTSIFVRKMECSYLYDASFGPVHFPDAEIPQGVAVGWGIFTPDGDQLL